MRFLSKLGLCFGAVFLCVLAASSTLFYALRNADEARERSHTANAVLLALGQAGTAHLDLAHTARGYLITKVERHAMLYGQATKLFADKITEAKLAAAPLPDVLKQINEVEGASRAWREQTGDPMLKLAQDAKTYDKAIEVAKSPAASVQQQAFREKFEGATNSLTALVRETDEIARESISWSKLAHMSGSAMALLTAVIAAILLMRSTARPIMQLTSTMQTLAAGNHNVSIDSAERSDEIGAMAKAVVSFREAAIAKQTAERDAAMARDSADQMRSSNEVERMRDMRAAQETCEELAAALERLAQGEFTYTITKAFAGDLDRLRTAFNSSIGRLRITMQEITSSSSVITTGVDEIAAASGDLSRRTENQAASLEEAAASIEQTVTMVRKTAEGAAHAHEIVSQTRQDVVRSGEVVERSIAAMGDIEKASRKIHDFIGIIDEIAFQTNLLALNAGVEAARAGEAGRGFAVVAQEVRALAQRSATAAQQVKELVGFSARSINDGVSLVGEAGTALARITAQIAGIDQIVAEMAAGTREQASGLDQLNIAVRQIDDSTQQNAAMAEQTTAAVEQVAGEAQRLRQLMREFQIGAASPMSRAA